MALMRNPACMATLVRWVANHIAKQGQDPEWISTLSEPIVMASLNFTKTFGGLC